MQLKLNAAGVCQAEWILISDLRLYNKDQEDILTSHDISLTSPLGLMLNSTYSSFPRKFLGRSSNSNKSQNASVFSVWALCLSPVLLHIISCLIHGCFIKQACTRVCVRSCALHPYSNIIMWILAEACFILTPPTSWLLSDPLSVQLFHENVVFLQPSSSSGRLPRCCSSTVLPRLPRPSVSTPQRISPSSLHPSVWCISNPSFTIAANSDSVGFWVLTRRWVIYSRGLFDLDHQTKRMKEWYDVISL